MGKYRRGGRFKATGYTEYSPLYQPPEPQGVTEPDYALHAFCSRLTPQPEKLDGPHPEESTFQGFFSSGSRPNYGPLTEETVGQLLTSTIVSSPFTRPEAEFSAPLPYKPRLMERSSDPMYSGSWGRPVQNALPPEPRINFLSADFRILGFPLSAINRAVSNSRRQRTERRLVEQQREWSRQFEAVKISNQKQILEFEERVRADPQYQAYLLEDRRWLEMAARIEADYDSAMARWNSHRQQFEAARDEEDWFFSRLRAAWDAKKPEAIQRAIGIAVDHSSVPWLATRRHRVQFDPSNGILLVEYNFPDVERLSFVDEGPRGPKPLGKTRRHVLQERLVYSVAMRLLFDLASLAKGTDVQGIALNGQTTFIDKTNGHERTETIVSIFAKPDELLSLRIDLIDPKVAFRALKGLMTANLSEYSPVAPIMHLDKSDSRIVEGRDVIGGLRQHENLAAMDWTDFEHLIRELFEKELAQNGVEVKVTRASRDSGVDAIAFDPDPLRGGKFVIQAKRYTRTVDVSAVRDLYGTLQNEGANRGILVTTSKFGPDSFEFARGKPITLIDGPNLLALLRKHGYEFSVDLEAARRLNT